MAPSRSKSTDAEPGDREGRRMLASLGLVGAVVGVLVLGAVLETGGDEPAGEVVEARSGHGDTPRGAAPPGGPAERDRRASEPAAAAPTTPAAPLEDLARRAASDLERLPRQGWLLQLLAACDPANVQRIVDRAPDDPRLHVLPLLLDDRACFRIAWGPFPSREHAVAGADDLPRGLRAITDAPRPKAVADLVP